MRKIEALGKVVCISEDSYNQLLKRFDSSNVKPHTRGYIVTISCPFCKGHRCDIKPVANYPSCPLLKFADKNFSGCGRLMYEITGDRDIGEHISSIWIGEEYIRWSKRNHHKALRELAKIHQAVEQLPVV